MATSKTRKGGLDSKGTGEVDRLRSEVSSLADDVKALVAAMQAGGGAASGRQGGSATVAPVRSGPVKGRVAADGEYYDFEAPLEIISDDPDFLIVKIDRVQATGKMSQSGESVIRARTNGRLGRRLPDGSMLLVQWLEFLGKK